MTKRKRGSNPKTRREGKDKGPQTTPLEQVLIECSVEARSLTISHLCDLVDKYQRHSHRLPMLALASTARAAVFNETLTDFADVVSGIVEKRKWDGGESLDPAVSFGEDKIFLRSFDDASTTLSLTLLERLFDSFVALHEAVEKACAKDQPLCEEQALQCASIPISKVGTLGSELVHEYAKKRRVKKNLLAKALPLIEAMRVHPGIDGRPHVYSAEERSAGYAALEALEKLAATFPYIQTYLDPPHVFAITNVTAPPSYNVIIPAARLAPNPVDASDGVTPAGLLTLQGGSADARWGGDLLRTHYLDMTGAGGAVAPLPLGAPVNVRIMSFATGAGGNIVFH